jgi:hypothetical protein
MWPSLETTMAGPWAERLRPRGPRRTDPVLMEIYDRLAPDVLYRIALMHHCVPPRYRTRASVKAGRSRAP